MTKKKKIKLIGKSYSRVWWLKKQRCKLSPIGWWAKKQPRCPGGCLTLRRIILHWAIAVKLVSYEKIELKFLEISHKRVVVLPSVWLNPSIWEGMCFYLVNNKKPETDLSNHKQEDLRMLNFKKGYKILYVLNLCLLD